MANTSLTLGKHWESFIQQEIASGRYNSASEVVRSGLRLLEESEANSKLKQLRLALLEGENSGDAGTLDMEAIRKEAKRSAGIDEC